MSKDSNLIAINSEMARMMQKKSCEARKRNKKEQENFQQIAKWIASLPLKSGKLDNVKAIKNYCELQGKNISTKHALVLSMFNEVITNGNTKAFELIVDILEPQAKNVVDTSALERLDAILSSLTQSAMQDQDGEEDES